MAVSPRTSSASNGRPASTIRGAIGAAATTAGSGASPSMVVMRISATSAVRLRAKSRPAQRGAWVAFTT